MDVFSGSWFLRGRHYLIFFVSFFVNLLYWLFNIGNLKRTLVIKKDLKITTKYVKLLKNTMSSFKWKKDLGDWYPWVITILDRGMEDDCDGAAILAKWLLKQIGVKSKLLLLVGRSGNNHMVCVSKELNLLVSNAQVIRLETEDHNKETLKLFNYKFYKVIEL